MSDNDRFEAARQETARLNEALLRNKEKFCPSCSGPSPTGGYCAVCMGNARLSEHGHARDALAPCNSCGMPAGTGCACSSSGRRDALLGDGCESVGGNRVPDNQAVYVDQFLEPAPDLDPAPQLSHGDEPRAPRTGEEDQSCGSQQSHEDWRQIDRVEHLALVVPGWQQEWGAFFAADPFASPERVQEQLRRMLERYDRNNQQARTLTPATAPPRTSEDELLRVADEQPQRQYCINCSSEVKTAGLCASCTVILEDRDIWSEVRHEVGLESSTTHPSTGGLAAAVADALAGGLVAGPESPGLVDLAVQRHSHAGRVREVQGVSGADVQSAHVGPTSFLRDVDGYSRSLAETVLLDREAHGALDAPWKDWAIEQRKQGRERVTVLEVHRIMLASIEGAPGLSERAKQAMAWRLHVELYGELELRSEQQVALPYANVGRRDDGVGPGPELNGDCDSR